jgi:prevent-host-death family protein
MRIIGSYQAKTHFSRLLAEVSQGEKVLITKNGKAIAQLIPVESETSMTRKEAVGKMQRLRKKLSKQKITLEELNEFKSKGRK